MYASQYLNVLREKQLNLEALFVNDYFMANKVLNSMQFDSGATSTNAQGMLSYTVIRNIENPNAASARNFGQDYQIVNANPEPETFYLKVLGGKYSIDWSLEEAVRMKNIENEARVKMDAAVKEFARQLIKGTGQNNEFIGIEKYCNDNNSIADVVLDISQGITQEVAQTFFAGFQTACGYLNVDPNVIYASRFMASQLKSMQAIMNVYTQPVKIENLEYSTYADVPIVPFDNNIGLRFTATDEEGLEPGAIYENIYILRIDKNDGVFCASPLGEQNFVRVVKPVETGSPIATGYVDFMTCLVPKNRKALIKVRVKVKEADTVGDSS